jgi:putative ABC transport system permease protein
MAVAILVASLWSFGSINYMIDITFFRTARHDAQVVFGAPEPQRTVFAVRQMPGVLAAEPFRTVTARISHRNLSKKLGLMGHPAGSELSRLLDVDLRPMALPEAGLILSEALADNLAVRPGDLVTVEVLEGNRRVVEVPVLGITRQYLGVSAYMRQESLNALLREGDVVSGAYLGVESGAEADVYARLHARPRVLGMVANASAIRSFYATIGEFVLFYNLVATLLAGSIGLGVVYNSARIALSERGRELASLRVLGFTRGEIAYILLGELALLTLAAIPVGLVVGIALVGALVLAYDSDLYRLPLLLTADNMALGAAVVVASALVSGLLVWHRLGRLDLIAVLKTRE